MNFDKRYWVFIAAAMISAITACGCTLYLATGQDHFIECNSLAAASFAWIGMVPSMILGILGLLLLMVAIPYLLHQNARPGLLSVAILSCIVVYTAFDAVNDVSAVLGYHNAYLIAHLVVDTTNNVTGSALGTGPSQC